MSQYDLTHVDVERSNELAEVFASIANDLIDDDEDPDDVVYAMLITINCIIAIKQAADAKKH